MNPFFTMLMSLAIWFLGFLCGWIFGRETKCLIFLFVFSTSANCQGFLDGSFVDRIAHIESRNNSAAIGDNGKARGAWQLTEPAWADVNSLRRRQQLPEYDWMMAHDAGIAREYAIQYISLLRKHLRAALRRGPTNTELLAGWQVGFTGFKKRSFIVPKSIERKLR